MSERVAELETAIRQALTYLEEPSRPTDRLNARIILGRALAATRAIAGENDATTE